MKFLEIWVSTPLARAVGWTLIHSLWEGTAVAAALAVVLSSVRAARARYAAAGVAMLVLLGAIGVTLVRVMPDGMKGIGNGTLQPFPAWIAVTGAQGAAQGLQGMAAAVPWLAPLWMLGVWIFVLAQLRGWLSVSRLRRQGVCCAPNHWQTELARLRARLRVSRPVQLLESCLADVPVVVGHMRPAILMPVGLLTGLPAGQVEAILLHELAHIGRHDYLVNLFQRAMESLLFYNPAVWWISRVIRTERENCCDDVVVATRGNAREYAVALTALEENRWSRSEAAMAATGGNLTNRIRRLLYPQPANGPWTPWLAAIILVSTATVAMAAWPLAPRRQTAGANHPQKVRDENSPYQKWLNEDVVYIITTQERDAFENLKTDDERKKFVEQFWERRNPRPGSPTNTYKEDHYRRLAYANQHFATAGKPGWQSDRGHALILYGRPDEIDAHPENKPFPYEEWMYRHVEELGDNVTLTFVDRSHSGDYQLAPRPMKKGASKNDSSPSQVPEAGKNGYSYPACVYCPAAQYTKQALAHKFQGRVTVGAVVTADGRPEDVKAMNKLPYGLSNQAVDAVKWWRFRPATGPDGKPAVVRQIILVSFHAY